MCLQFNFLNWLIILVVVLWGGGDSTVVCCLLRLWWWELLGVWMGEAQSKRVGVGRNLVMIIWVGINCGVGRIMCVKGPSGFLRFAKIECAGIVKLVYKLVWQCLMLFLWGFFAHCSLKVNSVAFHIVALFWIAQNICIYLGGNWCILVASTFRVFDIFFAWSRVWIVAVVTP